NGCLIDPNVPSDNIQQCNRETHYMMKTGSSVTHGNFTIRGCAQSEACSARKTMFRTVASSSSKMERLSKFVAAKQICATSYRYSTPIRSSSQYMRRAIYAQYMSTRAPYLHTIECFAGQKTERGGIMIADIPTNEGCRSITENGSRVDLCCCKANFCNTRSIGKTYKDQQKGYLEDLHAKGMALLPALTHEPRAPSRNEPRRKLNPFAKVASRVDHESRIVGWKNKNLLRQNQKSTAIAATTTMAVPVWDLPQNGPYPIEYRQFQTTSTVASTSTSSIRVYDEPYELGRSPIGHPESTAETFFSQITVSEIKCFGQQQSQRGPLIHAGILRTWSKISCSDVTHCMKAYADDSSQFGRITLHIKWGPQRETLLASPSEVCDWVDDKDIGKIHLCCCKGNYCNPAASLTGLLPIAVVAIVAINLY
ncbi:hypothetical protein PRIPAC_88075, partial [Pristionchus pacificus]|uniref:Uncharacterized protein n=1 Tax=Pristionchus pacificus TaxID=54126 RepID=A0A2A6B859_PRIPA